MKNNLPRSGHELFIVDNSVKGWTGLRYLAEWCSIAKSFDIATGYFEIGALLALDGQWQKLDRIRVLMGAETTHRTRRAILEAVRKRALDELEDRIEAEKDKNPFLQGVPGILEALRSSRIECRIYNKEKFHAKAYITHAKIEVVGAQALVGSSNFTRPGLTKNIELNVQIQSAREVAQLQEWFDAYWEEAVDVTETVIESVERHTRRFSPFEIYAKALQEFFRGHELTATEWDETKSEMFILLDRYQKEAYWTLMKIARQHGGAFLCDAVGLGKTFVGLMLIERLILHDGKRVVLFAPKAVREGVWEPSLGKYLSHIGGIGGSADFSNLAVFSHTDLGRSGDFPERFRRIAELADAVIIDEAHYFRNPGRRGDDAGRNPSRYYQLYDLFKQTNRPKTVFLLTATPINNRLSDFRHMMELFTRRDEAYFSRTVGVNHLRSHFNIMERELRNRVGQETVDATEHLTEAQEVLSSQEIFRQLVVQRSRAYARESQEREFGKSALFPKRLAPRVAKYSIRKTYGGMLDILETAFAKENPLFTLAMYYPLHWYIGPDKKIDPFEENRQRQVVGLIRTNFLKRFESSVIAFELSCNRLLQKLLAFVQAHCETNQEKRLLEHWMAKNAEVLGYGAARQLEIWEESEKGVEDEDIIPQELIDDVERLDRSEYDVGGMISETMADLRQIVRFLDEARKFQPKHDDKLQKLIRLLKSKELGGQKVLIFTEFAHTARYLKARLSEAGIEHVEQVDSATKRNRAEVIKRFSPYYNGFSIPELEAQELDEIRVLISTDVLSEGLNLQDASKLINYDIHWNPVRLMQRIGRVDRRMNPEIEKRLAADLPEMAASRGKVVFWNFLPPDELNQILSLYRKVTQKTLLISETLGIEGGKLLHPDDKYDDLKIWNKFNSEYEGTQTSTEKMHLEYQMLLQSDPDLEKKLNKFPGAVFSGKKQAANRRQGVFFCFSLPALDKNKDKFTEEAGITRWYFYDLNSEAILDKPEEIINSIRSRPHTARKCKIDQEKLVQIRRKIERHIKNTYLERVDAPIGVRPKLRCWMELNDG